jgi:hypothetical protein
MPIVGGTEYPYTRRGIRAADRARAGATTPAGGSPFSRVRRAPVGPLYGPNSRQKPPVDTRGTFNPPQRTDNITAVSTKPKVAGRASPY